MAMKQVFSLLAGIALALGLSAAAAQAQSHYSQEDLDAMLAPIALYPDELLSQVLIAATYPDDVAEARDYMDSHTSLTGSMLAYEVDGMPWDDSVKSLTQFPSLLAMLDDQPDWTDAVGYAFLYQQDDVMRTVQRLRQRARREGYLSSNDQQRVIVQNNAIIIQPVRSGYYYVPWYDPTVVYGRWWWPKRPPYYWNPPPRYRPRGYSVASGIYFGVGVGIVNSIFYPVQPDWHHHHVVIRAGKRPGQQWHWKPRPHQATKPGQVARPNRPPTKRPVLKPRPQRPQHNRRGATQTQPPRQGLPSHRQGQISRPQSPNVAKPAKPNTNPPRPATRDRRAVPATQSGQTQPAAKPAPETVRPTVNRPATRPAQENRPATAGPRSLPGKSSEAPAKPAMRPATPPGRPSVTPPRPAARPAPPAKPQAAHPAPNKPRQDHGRQSRDREKEKQHERN
jgi:hypothetical protein